MPMFKVNRWTKATSRKPRCLSSGSYSLYLQLTWNSKHEMRKAEEHLIIYWK